MRASSTRTYRRMRRTRRGAFRLGFRRFKRLRRSTRTASTLNDRSATPWPPPPVPAALRPSARDRTRPDPFTRTLPQAASHAEDAATATFDPPAAALHAGAPALRTSVCRPTLLNEDHWQTPGWSKRKNIRADHTPVLIPPPVIPPVQSELFTHHLQNVCQMRVKPKPQARRR